MSVRRVGTACALAAALLLPLAGCRDGAGADDPPSVSATDPPSVGTTDPLGEIDTTLDAIEDELSEAGGADG